MISKIYKYLTYREPYSSRGIESRYYSIGACLLVVGIIGIVSLVIAVAIASFEPQDVVHPVSVVSNKGTP